ncbi:hypothetical protein ABIC74_000724 [Mucilaginibacter rubeus]|uniref:hypothetical protein n=1 Tax=Mucilaginibacter rubeus TaxID=2027860 RepID=UPI0033979073
MSYRDWMVKKLAENEFSQEIDSAHPLGDNLIEIITEKGKTLIVGVIDTQTLITKDEVYNLYISGPKSPNIVVSKYGVVWHGSAIDFSRKQNIGWGGMGEINSAIDTEDYGDIQKREYQFVEEGLLKHSRVNHLERLYDRVFKIHRSGNLPPITITLIDSYELSGDEVRQAIKKYKSFDAILKTNPNGNPTGNAFSAASEIGAKIFVWKELYSRLTRI